MPIEISSDIIGTGSQDLPACSSVPEAPAQCLSRWQCSRTGSQLCVDDIVVAGFQAPSCQPSCICDLYVWCFFLGGGGRKIDETGKLAGGRDAATSAQARADQRCCGLLHVTSP
jgi:hypothetical protein